MAESHPHPPEWIFHAYLDEELDPEERSGFEAHLSSCLDCTQVLRELEHLFAAIAQVPAVPLERDLAAAVRYRLQAARSQGRLDKLAWLLVLELAGAALLLAVAGPTLAADAGRAVAWVGQQVAQATAGWEVLASAPGEWLELLPRTVTWPLAGHISLAETAPFLAVLWILGNLYLLRHGSVEAR